MRRTFTTTLTALATTMGLAFLLTAGAPRAAYAQPEPLDRGTLGLLFDYEEAILSEAPGSLHSPQAASAGSTAAFTWVQRASNGRDRVWGAILHDTESLVPPESVSPRPIDTATHGSGAYPAVSVSPVGGQALFAWVENGPEESFLWISRNGEEVERVYRSGGTLELPALGHDGEGTPYLSWSEVIGGRSSVHAAAPGADGEWNVFQLSVSERPYDVLPRIFGNEVGAEVYWFSIEGQDFVSRVAFIGRTGVIESATQELMDIPANRLPILYRVTEEQLLGAYWLEHYEGGELYLDLDPRFVEGSGPVPIGDLAANPEQPTVSSDLHGTKAWVETASGEEVKSLLVEVPWGPIVEFPVDASVREPVVTVSDTWVHLAWVERSPEGDTLRLQYARLR